MPYSKYKWTDGETVTEDKLNRLEDGIEQHTLSTHVELQGGGLNTGNLISDFR